MLIRLPQHQPASCNHCQQATNRHRDADRGVGVTVIHELLLNKPYGHQVRLEELVGTVNELMLEDPLGMDGHGQAGKGTLVQVPN